MTFNKVDTTIYQSKNIIFTEARGRVNYIFGLVNPGIHRIENQ